MSTKLITEIEAGQRYTDYHPSDMDGEVFTFVRTEPSTTPGFLWLYYSADDGDHRANVPDRMAVWPVRPAANADRHGNVTAREGCDR